MNERRRQRSEKTHEAMTLFLESLREKAGLLAVALTTKDGLLVAGVGQNLDLEWMGALGASCQRATMKWEEQTLHIQPLQVNDVELYLTSAGKAVHGPAIAAGLQRILA